MSKKFSAADLSRAKSRSNSRFGTGTFDVAPEALARLDSLDNHEAIKDIHDHQKCKQMHQENKRLMHELEKSSDSDKSQFVADI